MRYRTLCKNLPLFLAVVFTFGACADLEEDPQGLLTPQTFYQTNEELQAGVFAAYRPFMEYYLNAQGGLTMLGGDDVTSREGSNKEPYRAFDRFTANPSYDWLKRHNWDVLFQTVFFANAVLNNFENLEQSFSRDALVAEASFLRGWAYFSLVRMYGPVPIIRNTATGEEPRSPESEVYDLIIADLEFAVENLPQNWLGEPGRVRSWGAKSLLAKVYLTSAGWPLKRTENYARAASLAQDVVDNSPFALLSDFEAIWLPENPNNSESILAIQSCDNCGDWQLANRMPFSISAEAEEGGWDDYYAEINFFEEFPEGRRKDVTFQTTFSGNISWENTSQAHPYYQKTRGFESAKISSLNAYVLRMADVHLLYAEAQNKADGAPNFAAYEAVNQVRRRAAGLDINTPDADVDLAGLSGDEFHAAVLQERAWELAAEWERWFDMVRNQIVAEATADREFDRELPLNPAVDVSNESSFEPYYYAPIPQNEMLLRPDWTQNPCCM